MRLRHLFLSRYISRNSCRSFLSSLDTQKCKFMAFKYQCKTKPLIDTAKYENIYSILWAPNWIFEIQPLRRQEFKKFLI